MVEWYLLNTWMRFFLFVDVTLCQVVAIFVPLVDTDDSKFERTRHENGGKWTQQKDKGDA